MLFHYMCDGYDDRGFGCVYRSVQNAVFQRGLAAPTMKRLMEAVKNPGSRWSEPAQFVQVLTDMHIRVETALYLHNDAAAASMMFTCPSDYRLKLGTEEMRAWLRDGMPTVWDNGTFGYTCVGDTLWDPHTTVSDDVVREFNPTHDTAPCIMALKLY